MVYHIQPMTVEELIEHLRTLPQRYPVYFNGVEPVTKDDFIESNRRGTKIILRGFIRSKECYHADECMHFSRARS